MFLVGRFPLPLWESSGSGCWYYRWDNSFRFVSPLLRGLLCFEEDLFYSFSCLVGVPVTVPNPILPPTGIDTQLQLGRLASRRCRGVPPAFGVTVLEDFQLHLTGPTIPIKKQNKTCLTPERWRPTQKKAELRAERSDVTGAPGSSPSCSPQSPGFLLHEPIQYFFSVFRFYFIVLRIFNMRSTSPTDF